MRHLSLLIIISFTLLSADSSIFQRNSPEKPKEVDNKAMCKLFTEKAKNYEAKMRDDDYARATLESYKNRAALYCKK